MIKSVKSFFVFFLSLAWLVGGVDVFAANTVTYCSTSREVNVAAEEGYDEYLFQLSATSPMVHAGSAAKFAFELPKGQAAPSKTSFKLFGKNGAAEPVALEVDLKEFEVVASINEITSGLSDETGAPFGTTNTRTWLLFPTSVTSKPTAAQFALAKPYTEGTTVPAFLPYSAIEPCGQWVALVVENYGCCKDTAYQYVVPAPACPDGFAQGKKEVELATATDAKECVAKGLTGFDFKACSVTWSALGKSGNDNEGVADLVFTDGQTIRWTLTNGAGTTAKTAYCDATIKVKDNSAPKCPSVGTRPALISVKQCALSAADLTAKVVEFVTSNNERLDNCVQNKDLKVEVVGARDLTPDYKNSFNYTISDGTNKRTGCAIDVEVKYPGVILPPNGETEVACEDLAMVEPALPVVKNEYGDVLGDCGHNRLPKDLDFDPCGDNMVYSYSYQACANKPTDPANVIKTWTYTYHVVKTAPVVNVTSTGTPKEVSCMSEATQPAGTLVPTATSSCGETVLASSTVNRKEEAVGTDGTVKVTYTYTFTDPKCSSLSSTWNYVYHVKDKAPECPTTPIVLEDFGNGASHCSYSQDEILAEFKKDKYIKGTDNCGAVTAADADVEWPAGDAEGKYRVNADGSDQTFTLKYVLTDGSGNKSAQCAATFKVVNTIKAECPETKKKPRLELTLETDASCAVKGNAIIKKFNEAYNANPESVGFINCHVPFSPQLNVDANANYSTSQTFTYTLTSANNKVATCSTDVVIKNGVKPMCASKYVELRLETGENCGVPASKVIEAFNKIDPKTLGSVACSLPLTAKLEIEENGVMLPGAQMGYYLEKYTLIAPNNKTESCYKAKIFITDTRTLQCTTAADALEQTLYVDNNCEASLSTFKDATADYAHPCDTEYEIGEPAIAVAYAYKKADAATYTNVASLAALKALQLPVGIYDIKTTFTRPSSKGFNATSVTCNQKLNVVDNVDPTCVKVASLTLDAKASCDSLHTLSLKGNDNCEVKEIKWSVSGATTVAEAAVANADNNATANFKPGVSTVSWTVVDASGHTAQCSTKVTVRDGGVPACPKNPVTVELSATADKCEFTKDDVLVELKKLDFGSDNCTQVGQLDVIATTNMKFSYQNTHPTAAKMYYTIVDLAENEKECTTMVVVEDKVAPTCINLNLGKIATTTNNNCKIDSAAVKAKFNEILITEKGSDNCGDDFVSAAVDWVESGKINEYTTKADGADNLYTIYYKTKDAAGNASDFCKVDFVVVNGVQPTCPKPQMNITLFTGGDACNVTGKAIREEFFTRLNEQTELHPCGLPVKKEITSTMTDDAVPFYPANTGHIIVYELEAENNQIARCTTEIIIKDNRELECKGTVASQTVDAGADCKGTLAGITMANADYKGTCATNYNGAPAVTTTYAYKSNDANDFTEVASLAALQAVKLNVGTYTIKSTFKREASADGLYAATSAVCEQQVVVADRTAPVCPTFASALAIDACEQTAEEIRAFIESTVKGYADKLDNCTANDQLKVTVKNAAAQTATQDAVTYHYTVADKAEIANVSEQCAVTIKLKIDDNITISKEDGQTNISCISDEAIKAPHAPGSGIEMPVVTDAKGNELKYSSVKRTPEVFPEKFCNGDIIYTYTYSDCSGHEAKWKFTYHYAANGKPTLKPDAKFPADVDAGNGCFESFSAQPLASIDDIKALYESLCSKTDISVSSSDSKKKYTSNNTWAITRTFVIADGCNDTIHRLQTITGYDKERPKCPEDAITIDGFTTTADKCIFDRDTIIKRFNKVPLEKKGTDNCGLKGSDFWWKESGNIFDYIAEADGSTKEYTLYYKLTDIYNNKSDELCPVSFTVSNGVAPSCPDEALPLLMESGENCTVTGAEVKKKFESLDIALKGKHPCGLAFTAATKNVADDAIFSPSTTAEITYVLTAANNKVQECKARVVVTDVEGPVCPKVAEAIATLDQCEASADDITNTIVAFVKNYAKDLDNCTAKADLDVEVKDAAIQKANSEVTYHYVLTDAATNKSDECAAKIKVEIADFTISPATDGKTVDCPKDVKAPHLVEPSIMPVVKDAKKTPLTPTLTSSPASEPACNGEMVYVYTYEDCAGHSKTWTYTYTISRPALTLKEDGGSVIPCVKDTTMPTAPAISDVCGTPATVKQNGKQVEEMKADGSGKVTYNFTYTDCAGQTYPWKYVYTVTPNAFTPVENGSKDVPCIKDAIAPITPDLEVCGAPIVFKFEGKEDNAFATGCGTVIYNYSYIVNGKSYTWKYTYNVSHTTAPVEVEVDGKLAVASSEVECAAAAVEPAADKLPKVVDVCGNVLPAPAPEVGGTYTDCEGTKTYTYTYKDCANKQFVWTYTYTIKRTTAPAEEAVAGKKAETSSKVSCADKAVAPAADKLPVVKDVCGNVLPAPAPEIGASLRATAPRHTPTPTPIVPASSSCGRTPTPSRRQHR